MIKLVHVYNYELIKISSKRINLPLSIEEFRCPLECARKSDQERTICMKRGLEEIGFDIL